MVYTSMPIKFNKTPYYDLVINTLLNPILIEKYIHAINTQYLVVVNNPELITFNLMPLSISYMYIYTNRPSSIYMRQHFVYNKNRVDFYSIWNRLDSWVVLGKINNYIQCLFEDRFLDVSKYKLLRKLVSNNTYKIYDILSKVMCDVYFNKYIAPSVIRALAINKIKRNKLYYCGLAKKLSMRDCGIELEDN